MEAILSSATVQIVTLSAVALTLITSPLLQLVVARRLPVSVAGTYRRLATNTYMRVVLMLAPVFLAASIGYQRDSLSQSVAIWFVGLLLFGGLSVCWAAHLARHDLKVAKSRDESAQRAARLSQVLRLANCTMAISLVSVVFGGLGAAYMLSIRSAPPWFWAIPFLLSFLPIISNAISVCIAAVARAYASDPKLGAEPAGI